MHSQRFRTLPTSAQLRHAIDAGMTGDKVQAPDPASAPLGTDDEAAGKPPTPSEIAEALNNEIGRPVASGGDRTPGSGFTAYLILAGGAAVVIILGAILAMQI